MSSPCIQNVKRYLCVKKLTVNDGFTSKTVKLPRAEARFFMGELRNRQSIPLVLLDEGGRCWELLCTCTGGQYALSRIGAFCEAHGAQPGGYFIFYADHEHVVRLAVRRHLPEDVQAAVAAARAALAVRNAAQRSPQKPQPAAGTAAPDPSAPPGAPALPAEAPAPILQPVLDDPAALDEMPPPSPPLGRVAAAKTAAGAAAAEGATALAQELVPVQGDAEPPPPASRALPLQDLSNLSKPLASGTKPPLPTADAIKPQKPGSPAFAAPPAGPARGDKENSDPSLPRAGGGADQQPNAGTVAGSVPTDKLPLSPKASPASPPPSQSPSPASQPAPSPSRHAPAPSAATAQPSALPQRSPSPRPPSPAPMRSRSCGSGVKPPSPPPASRVRQRFEARLRAQAGRPHPLSVRTDPSSPPPLAPGRISSHGSGTSGFLSVVSGWLAPRASGSATALPVPPPHLLLGAGSGAMAAAAGAGALAGSRTITAHGGTGTPSPLRSTRAQQQQQPPRHLQPQPQLPQPDAVARPVWRRTLQCDELMEWEVGRRVAPPVLPPIAAAAGAGGRTGGPALGGRGPGPHTGRADTPASPPPPSSPPTVGYPTDAELSLATLPGWVLRRSIVVPAAANAALVEHATTQQKPQRQGQGQDYTSQPGGGAPACSQGVSGGEELPPPPPAAGSLRQLLGLGEPQLRQLDVFTRSPLLPAGVQLSSHPLDGGAYPRTAPALHGASFPLLPLFQRTAGVSAGRRIWLPWDRNYGASDYTGADMEVDAPSRCGRQAACDGVAAGTRGASPFQQSRRRPQEPHEDSPRSKRHRAATGSRPGSAPRQGDSPRAPVPTSVSARPEPASEDGTRAQESTAAASGLSARPAPAAEPGAACAAKPGAQTAPVEPQPALASARMDAHALPSQGTGTGTQQRPTEQSPVSAPAPESLSGSPRPSTQRGLTELKSAARDLSTDSAALGLMPPRGAGSAASSSGAGAEQAALTGGLADEPAGLNTGPPTEERRCRQRGTRSSISDPMDVDDTEAPPRAMANAAGAGTEARAAEERRAGLAVRQEAADAVVEEEGGGGTQYRCALVQQQQPVTDGTLAGGGERSSEREPVGRRPYLAQQQASGGDTLEPWIGGNGNNGQVGAGSPLPLLLQAKLARRRSAASGHGGGRSVEQYEHAGM